jgi:hypothetical protein
MKIEHLDLGLVYFPGIIDKPDLIIKDIENLDKLLKDNPEKAAKSRAKQWHKWEDGDQFFCWQKGIFNVEDLRQSDPFYEEQLNIAKRLFEPLDYALEEYYNIFPIAKQNVKGREGQMHILKYEAGHYLPPHADQGISTRILSGLTYLNDDYEGGELNFPQSKIKMKPEAGSIIFFPSNFVYVHSIDLMTSGSRYALPHWYHNRKEIVESNGSV